MQYLNISHLITILVALFGWFVVHRLTAWRDRVNHRRQLKTEYLISAYCRLANSANRAPMKDSPYFRDMESAIADIQLFGTKKDIELVYSFLTEFTQKGQATLDPLLLELRNRLRDELGYKEISENVRWLRFEGSPDTTAEPLNAPDR